MLNGLTVIRETHACLHGEKVACGTLVQLVLEGRTLAEIHEVMAFCAAVGLPLTLQALGIASWPPTKPGRWRCEPWRSWITTLIGIT